MPDEFPIMERARAARALIDASPAQAQEAEMAAFLRLFHPELKPDHVRNMITDARERDRKRRNA